MRLPGKIKGQGWHIPWYMRDPKHPNGPPVPVLIADADTGEIVNHNGNPAIVMWKVRARLFREGAYAADVVAAKITANQRDQILVGTGGCKVTSPLENAETVVTADKITWNTKASKIVAVGHAHVVRRPRNSSRDNPPITQEGGKITYDLARGEVSVQ
jgi:hypothetical protein